VLGSIVMRYKKSCETSEKQRDESLKTHYYKGTYRQVYDAVENLLNQDPNYQLEHASSERGEFSVQLKNRKNYFFIITIVAVKPFEIAVDLHISTEKFSLLGVYPTLKNEVLSFYEKLGKKVPFVGSGRGN
jgi:hypothetical protein